MQEWEEELLARYSGLLDTSNAIDFLQDELDRVTGERVALSKQMGELTKNETVQEYDAKTAMLAELLEKYRTHCALESENDD